jgi:hypothetical protein
MFCKRLGDLFATLEIKLHFLSKLHVDDDTPTFKIHFNLDVSRLEQG